MKSFPIDFIRQIVEQTLAEQHYLNPFKYYGGKDQVSLMSFYEQLQKEEEVNRYVEIYNDLVDQQNRTGLIMNGTILAPENPTITNLYNSLIIPLTFTLYFRVKLEDRDTALETMYNVIDLLKGRKSDIAEFENGQLFKVGTLLNPVDNYDLKINDGDFLLKTTNATLQTDIAAKLNKLSNMGVDVSNNTFVGVWELIEVSPTYKYYQCDFDITEHFKNYYGGNLPNVNQIKMVRNWWRDYNNVNIDTTGITSEEVVKVGNKLYYRISYDYDKYVLGNYTPTSLCNFEITYLPLNKYLYCEIQDTNQIKILKYDFETGLYITYNTLEECPIDIPPSSQIVNKYQVSMSFDSIRCDEPRILNANEYCVISMGGSATIVNDGLMLGNELVRLGVKRDKIKASTDITFNDDIEWLEPLEMPSGNSADTQINQMLKGANKFIPTTHSDSTSPTLQYTFVLDRQSNILNKWFKYARYGIQNIDTSGETPNYDNAITPNIIYEIKEIWSSWGNVEEYTFKAKIIESIDIENTESDTITLTIPFQLQEQGGGN